MTQGKKQVPPPLMTATVEPPSGQRSATVELPEPPANESDAVSAYLALSGVENQDTVAVFRASETGAPAYLFSVDAQMPPDRLMRRIREDYGTGQYRFQVRQGGRIVKNYLIGVEAEPVRGAAVAAAAAPVAAPQVDMTQFMLAQMQQAQQMTTQVITAALGRPLAERPGVDIPKLLAAAAPLVVPAVAGIVELVKSRPDPLDMATKMVKIKELFGGGGDGGGRETGVMDVLAEGLKTLGPILDRASQAPPQQHVATVQQPRPAAIASKPVDTPPNITKANTPANHPLNALLAALVRAAEKSGDPYTYAEVIIDQWPGTPEQLTVLMNNPQWLETLARFEPRVLAHAEWFKQVHLALTEPEADDDPDGDPGDEAGGLDTAAAAQQDDGGA